MGKAKRLRKAKSRNAFVKNIFKPYWRDDKGMRMVKVNLPKKTKGRIQ